MLITSHSTGGDGELRRFYLNFSHALPSLIILEGPFGFMTSGIICMSFSRLSQLMLNKITRCDLPSEEFPLRRKSSKSDVPVPCRGRTAPLKRLLWYINRTTVRQASFVFANIGGVGLRQSRCHHH